MPHTFRASGSKMTNGSPVCDDGIWYSRWSMRPSRDVCSIAIGLKRRDLEDRQDRVIRCTNGPSPTQRWTPHHIYECGIPGCTTAEKAKRFTDLANLVLISTGFHREFHSFVHGEGEGAKWFRYIASVLYPRAGRPFENIQEKPVDSPSIEQINIAEENHDALFYLIDLREREPAGNALATLRLTQRQEAGQTHPASYRDMPPPASESSVDTYVSAVAPSATISPTLLVTDLRERGYLARQNKTQTSLYLNLGGPNSEIDSDGFRGAVLLFPAKNIIFGICPEQLVAFREVVMERSSGGWVRKGSGGPAARNRFALELKEYRSEQTLFSTAQGGLRIEGFPKRVICIDGQYFRSTVEDFLAELSVFCSES